MAFSLSVFRALRARRWLVAVFASSLCVTACGGPRPSTAPAAELVAAGPSQFVVTVVGTSDVHGHVEGMAWFAAHLDVLRQRPGGQLVLLDAGDVFQGTLESNLGEGDVMIDAYAALGYDAVAIGNHEFDFGPVGPNATPQAAGDDPRGALKARTAQAGSHFPFLLANVVSEDGGPIEWPNVVPSTLLAAGPVRVGIVGVATESTPQTTISANFAGLRVTPLAESIAREASSLRARGADIVIALAHAGLRCDELDDPRDTSSCDLDEELAQVVQALPEGAVDLVLGGHNHRPVGHYIGSVPVIQAEPYGRGFARADLVLDATTRRVVDSRVYPPRSMCGADREPPDCAPGDYEGVAITASARLGAVLAPAIARAEELKGRALGVTLTGSVERAYGEESALGNLFADLMLGAVEGADAALMNGGGLRADLPAGELRYGSLFEAMPFDNRLATLRMTSADLADVLARNLRGTGGILSLAGMTAVARCDGGEVTVDLFRDGRRLRPNQPLLVVASDFLAMGGGSTFTAAQQAEDRVSILDRLLRDAMADGLSARTGPVDPGALFEESRRRLSFEGARPVACSAD